MFGTRKYLGFDISTQSLKVVVINSMLQVVAEEQVNYDTDLPEFRTRGGVQTKSECVTSPSLMWVKALDLVLEKLKVSSKISFASIAGLSGCAQQHGSVYWKMNAKKTLQNLNASKFLHEQLQGCFALRDSPVWMDSSTGLQCKRLEKAVGGAQKLSELTGSIAYERFTGNQIMKIYENTPEIYHNTERISLVSSFAASIFLGDYACIDYSDGSGMNLMNLTTKDWNDNCLEAVAPGLREKLGELVPAFKVLGPIAPYFVERYGFSSDCRVVAFTGDNPATIAGLKLREGDVVISLGTSDTVLFVTRTPKTVSEGHVLCSPMELNSYFVMLCFKNASIVRERLRDECADGSWDLFSDLLQSTPVGNFGNIGMYFDVPEIIPPICGEFKFNKQNEEVSYFSKEVEVRAIIESQALAKKLHAEKLGFQLGKNSRIIAAGGAARNKAILQVLADVFACPVYSSKITDAASLGAAFLAKFGCVAEPEIGYFDAMEGGTEAELVAIPNNQATKVYQLALSRYAKLEEKVSQKKDQ